MKPGTSNRQAPVTLILNPVAGGEDAEARREAIRESVARTGVACDIEETSEEKDAGFLARVALERGAGRVIVSGGDGTVARAADALAGSSAVLAVLPSGTANLLALNAGIPNDHDPALHLALTGEPRPFDVGRANGEIFLIVVGMGADAAAVRDADRDSKDRLGPLAYVIAAARHAARPRIRYRLNIDGRRLVRRARTVLVANAGQLPGQAAFVPEADPHDGTLDVAIVRARSPLDVWRVGVDMLLGRSQHPHRMETHRGRHIVIETDSPQPVQRDGDEHEPCARLEVSIEPSALNLVHPPNSEAAHWNAGATLPAPLAHGKPLLVALAALALVVLAILLRRSRKP
jgi:YegS/Rv2252/BmrU family lipid kinase